MNVPGLERSSRRGPGDLRPCEHKVAGGQDPAAERRRRQEVRLASFLSLKSSLSFFDFLNSDSMFEIEMKCIFNSSSNTSVKYECNKFKNH